MKKIMVLDDDWEFLDEVCDVLNSNGFTTVPLSEGSCASLIAAKFQPDLILLDLKLGKKSGFMIADSLRGNEETKNIPIIAITGFYVDDSYKELIDAVGVKKCLIKPCDPVALIKAVNEVIG